MRIFVTGGAGFLGSWLVETFVEAGHDVVSVDNFIGGSPENVIKSPAHSFHEADILDLDQMTQWMAGCEVVYHTAALAYEGLSVFSPHLVTQNIVSGSVSAMTAAIQNRARRFVQCSSMARYGSGIPPFRETHDPRPEDPYGMAKLCAERQITLLGDLHGVEVVIAAPHNIIGPRQKYDDPFRNVASIMINLMMQGRQPIIYGDGTQKRCFSYVTDVLSTLTRMVDCPLEMPGEVFNVGPDEQPVTINELAETIAELLGFALDPVYVPARPAEVKLAVCSSDKIRQRFGYMTQVSLRDGLAAMIEHIRRSGGPRPFKYHLPIEILNESVPATWRERRF